MNLKLFHFFRPLGLPSVIILLLFGIGLTTYSSDIQAECNFVIKAAMVVKRNNNSFLGEPTSDFTDLNDTNIEGGCYRNFQHGSLYASNKTGVQMVYGAIKSRWLALGGVKFLGLPTTDETATPDGIGRYNHFQRGSIYWHPCIGAYEVHGLILQKWSSLGWEKSFLGYPKSNEMPTSDGVGRYSEFQNGRIYWHPQYGTFPVSRAILRQWADLGYEKSTFGYPIGDMKCPASTLTNLTPACSQKFRNGIITENFNTVDLRGEIGRRGIAIRNQGARPTCSVFASTFLLEYAYTGLCGNHYNNLSEEYLNHVANLATTSTDDGDFFSNIIAGYEKYGIVTETQLPYMNAYDFNTYSLSDDTINAGLSQIKPYIKMKATWIRSLAPTPGLSNTEFNQILNYIKKGIPVAIGRSHSLVIVGYEKGNAFPGGGRFIIRNSYGPNLAGTVNGYQFEDFKNVKETVYDTYVFTK